MVDGENGQSRQYEDFSLEVASDSKETVGCSLEFRTTRMKNRIRVKERQTALHSEESYTLYWLLSSKSNSCCALVSKESAAMWTWHFIE